MKKLLLVLAIGAFAACGSGTGDTTTHDTTSTSTMSADSTTVAPVMPNATTGDSSMKMNDTSSMKMKKDSTKM
ncbi:MAG: hypothetical protein M3R72_07910 [Bacteroidota bacterium]|nr:hypothetical protein [Bacteroidota bacterium]